MHTPRSGRTLHRCTVEGFHLAKRNINLPSDFARTTRVSFSLGARAPPETHPLSLRAASFPFLVPMVTPAICARSASVGKEFKAMASSSGYVAVDAPDAPEAETTGRNLNPEIKTVLRKRQDSAKESLPLELRIFEYMRDIRDPEHPNTLEELSVVDEQSVTVYAPVGEKKGLVKVEFQPTVPHCSMASLIGLSIRAKLQDARVVPENYKLDVDVLEGSHATGDDITKQLNDKERVAAALENKTLRNLVDDCLKGVGHLREDPY